MLTQHLSPSYVVLLTIEPGKVLMLKALKIAVIAFAIGIYLAAMVWFSVGLIHLILCNFFGNC